MDIDAGLEFIEESVKSGKPAPFICTFAQRSSMGRTVLGVVRWPAARLWFRLGERPMEPEGMLTRKQF